MKKITLSSFILVHLARSPGYSQLDDFRSKILRLSFSPNTTTATTMAPTQTGITLSPSLLAAWSAAITDTSHALRLLNVRSLSPQLDHALTANTEQLSIKDESITLASAHEGSSASGFQVDFRLFELPGVIDPQQPAYYLYRSVLLVLCPLPHPSASPLTHTHTPQLRRTKQMAPLLIRPRRRARPPKDALCRNSRDATLRPRLNRRRGAQERFRYFSCTLSFPSFFLLVNGRELMQCDATERTR